MTALSFDGLPAWAVPLGLAAHLAAGIGLGAFYFQALWWNTQRFAAGGRLTTATALTIGRFALLGGVLFLASQEGALPLLAVALGILVARAVVMRRVRRAA